MPKVSIITPTINRQELLPALWDCIRAQSVQDFEWLVHDGSPERAQMFDGIHDQRVRYMPLPGEMSIGVKRNHLCDVARGEIIAHFDDDDSYGPRYIERMLSFMEDLHVDFVKLFGFFLYHRTRREFAYWNLEKDFPQHYLLGPNPAQHRTLARYRGGATAQWGYGFSYVDQNHGEDHVFADKVVAKYKSSGRQDFACSCLHVIHASNESIAFPQQILPIESLSRLFPDFHAI